MSKAVEKWKSIAFSRKTRNSVAFFNANAIFPRLNRQFHLINAHRWLAGRVAGSNSVAIFTVIKLAGITFY